MSKQDRRWGPWEWFTYLALAGMAITSSYLAGQYQQENRRLVAAIRNLEAETANRAATSELQSRVIAAYTAELMRAGYSEDRLDAIQRSK